MCYSLCLQIRKWILNYRQYRQSGGKQILTQLCFQSPKRSSAMLPPKIKVIFKWQSPISLIWWKALKYINAYDWGFTYGTQPRSNREISRAILVLHGSADCIFINKKPLLYKHLPWCSWSLSLPTPGPVSVKASSENGNRGWRDNLQASCP